MDQTNCATCGILIPKPRTTQRFCRPKCREQAWIDQHRLENNKRVREYRRRRYEKHGHWRDEGPKAAAQKSWMIEIKSGPCHDCGNKFPTCCMDFDHRSGETKSYNVGNMFAHHYARELIETEIAKCDLVCANCHRVRTRNRRIGSGNSFSGISENTSL